MAYRLLTILFVLFSVSLFGETSQKLQTIYNSLDPRSVSQHLAFYQLYPEAPEGAKALRDAWQLMRGKKSGTTTVHDIPNIDAIIEGVINLVNKNDSDTITVLDNRTLEAIENLAAFLPNRKLKGHRVTTEKEVLELSPEDIDLARNLFISQMASDGEDHLQKIRSYEAMIDLMALQILTHISLDSTPETKIREMNRFIFHEMGFRFPPHSLYAKDIDVYTFLPSVLDSRRGVCLGVSILYICLAQRLNLSLEMITPPGHIYVRYSDGKKVINIETTARGIDLDDEVYLSVDTKSLQERNIKEVIGLAHFNHASTYWQKDEYQKAVDTYLKAYLYLPNDPLLKELLAYNYLFVGEKEKGMALLNEVKDYDSPYQVCSRKLIQEVLSGDTDPEGVKILFMHVDENRESVIKKRERIEEFLKSNPKFSSGYFCLAVTWLQLHRFDKAQVFLEKHHELYPEDPNAEYMMAAIYAERLNLQKAWKHLQIAEKLVHKQNHFPKTLKMLRKQLSYKCPE